MNGSPTPKKPLILLAITKSNWGGAGRYVYDLATSLLERHGATHDVAVALGGNGTLMQKLQESGIRTIPLVHTHKNINPLEDIRSLIELIRIIRHERPAVLHLNSSKIGFTGSLAGRLTRVPHVIFTAHGWAFNEHRSFIEKWIFRTVHWITLLLAHHTIAVSEKTAFDVRRFPGIAHRITVIHNGISAIPFYSRTTARKELEKFSTAIKTLPKNTVWIGTFSELHKNKGIDFAIQAMSRIKEKPFVFLIMGEGPERDALHKRIVDLDMADKCIFMGQVPNAPYYLKALDIFTLTSRTEAFPYAILEAATAGTAVIASAVGGIPEIIRQLETGVLVKPGNIKELSHALTLLIESKEKRAALGTALAATTKQSYTPEEMLTKTEKIYGIRHAA